MNEIKGYISIREASYRWGVSERRVNQYCAEGRIPSALELEASAKGSERYDLRRGFIPPISERRRRRAQCPDEKYGDPMTLYIDGYLHDVHESEELMLDVLPICSRKNPASGTAASRRISIRRRGTWHCAIRANESRCSALMH